MGARNGCDWNSETCSNAAWSGHLEILKWATKNGCEWNREICNKAAERGHLEVLKWLIQNGCYWDSTVCLYASWGLSMEYLRGNSKRNKHLEVIEWIKQNCCICGGEYHKYEMNTNKIRIGDLYVDIHLK